MTVAGIPTLYTLFGTALQTGVLTLHAACIQAYDFTFG